MAASTQTATILVADLVGSTAFRVRVGEETADRVRREHDRQLGRAIDDHAGTLVKGMGDGVLASFASAVDAVSAAVSMQQRIAATAGPEALQYRIGISGGDVSFENGDCFGTPVVEAARLCAAADGGQILVADLVRVMARGRGGHTYEPVGELTLKGLAEPIPASSVDWEPIEIVDAEPSEHTLPPLQRRLWSDDRLFVGRQDELDRLRTAWRAASAGSPSLVLLGGEPGIGKTTLMSRLARAVQRDGGEVLYGRSDEVTGVPFQPWSEAVAHHLSHVDDTRHAAQRAVLGPLLAPARAGTDPEAERVILFNAVASLLREISASAPLLLVLDDAHWSDASSVQLTRHVLGALEGERLLLAVTYRDGELGSEHPFTHLLADLRRDDRALRVPLSGLAPVDVLALVEERLATTAVDVGAVADEIARESEGNPFFIGELVAHVHDGDGRLALPESIRDVVGQRVRRLGTPADRVLTTGAVIGRDFALDLLVTVAEMTEDDVLDALESAIEAQLITEAGADRFTFRHALIQHTLYAELSESRRVRIHARVAEAMTGSGSHVSSPAEIAAHWLAAVRPVHLDKAIDASIAAGDHALDRLAPAEAQLWFDKAIELLPPDDGRRPRCLLGLGMAGTQLADAAARATLLEAASLARSSGQAEVLARAALAMSRGWSTTGTVDRDFVALLETALDALAPEPSELRALVTATLAAELVSDLDHERRCNTAETAIDIARAVGDSTTLVQVLQRCHQPLQIPDRLELRRSISAEGVALSSSCRDAVSRTLIATDMLIDASHAADRGSLDAALEMLVERSEAANHPVLRWNARFGCAWHALLLGDAEAADRLASEALDLGIASGQEDALLIFGVQLFMIRRHQGRLEELVDLATQMYADNPGVPAVAGPLATIDAETGRLTEATALLDEFAEDGFALPYDFTWITGHLCFGEAAVITEHDSMPTLYERLLPWREQGGNTGAGYDGSVALVLGRLATAMGDPSAALDHLALADAAHRAIGAPFHLARTHVATADALHARGDAHAAALALDKASSLAQTYGCTGIDREVAARRAA